MSARSKKEAENMYGDMFGDLSALASDDSGEINSFASDVINREVNANWRHNIGEGLGDMWRWIRHRGDYDKIRANQLFKEEQTTKHLLDAAQKRKYNRLLTDPNVFPIFEADINKQVRDIVNNAIANVRKTNPKQADSMQREIDEITKDVKASFMKTLNRGDIIEDASHLTMSGRKIPAGNGRFDIDAPDIKLSRTDLQNHIDDLKSQQIDRAKKVDEVQKRIDARKGDTKDVNGQKWKFNGVKWVLIGTAATGAWLNKDKIQGGIEGMFKNNNGVEVGPKDTGSDSGSGSSSAGQKSSSGYDPSQSHETSPGVMNNVNPGGANTPQAPRAYGQDAWDKFKTAPPTQRRRFESDSDYENGWWNAPSTSKPTYDDMGYVGGADESWTRTAQKSSPNPDELDNSALNDYGADQVLAAQNFLSYYGLGTGKQPGKQIVESLLMGNFDGKSFEEYKNTHSEDEVRQAMKRFEKGLRMFSTEMGKLANGLDAFYEERQRRLESQKAKQVQPNEQPQRTE